MPTPDIATLGFILFLVYLVNSLLSILMAASGRTFPGHRLWVCAQLSIAAGALLIFLRPVLDPRLSIVVGNTLFIAASVPLAHAAWAFRYERPFPKRFYALIPLVLASFLLGSEATFPIRSMVYAAWTSVGAFFVGGLLVWRVTPRYRTASRIAATPFFLIAAASVVRFFVNLLFPFQGDFYQQDGFNALYLIGAVLVSPVTLFGYFMLTGIRAEQVLELKDAQIEARNHKLIDSNRSKDLFFSIIAHDLRGPIGGAARYVRKHLLGKLTGLEAKYSEVETLAAALDKTNEFLEKLLWWSRAQHQDWAPDRVPVDLKPALDQALSLVRSAADLKEIPVTLSPGPYPRPLADPESVQIILGNLLSNAVKFSLPGRPIHFEVVEVGAICRITIEDEGVGMDQKTLERLFRIEDKLTTHGTSGERGSGLGLLLSRSLAERNDGGISIESEPGVGTRATLWLPTKPLGSRS